MSFGLSPFIYHQRFYPMISIRFPNTAPTKMTIFVATTAADLCHGSSHAVDPFNQTMIFQSDMLACGIGISIKIPFSKQGSGNLLHHKCLLVWDGDVLNCHHQSSHRLNAVEAPLQLPCQPHTFGVPGACWNQKLACLRLGALSCIILLLEAKEDIMLLQGSYSNDYALTIWWTNSLLSNQLIRYYYI